MVVRDSLESSLGEEEGERFVYREWTSKRARESESEGGLDKDCEQARTEGGSVKTTDRMPTEE